MLPEIPKPIVERWEELNKLVDEYPLYIPLNVLASFLGMSDEGLRAAIDNGKCPFGISWKLIGKVNRGFKIPTFTFYMWYTKGKTLIPQLAENNSNQLGLTK